MGAQGVKRTVCSHTCSFPTSPLCSVTSSLFFSHLLKVPFAVLISSPRKVTRLCCRHCQALGGERPILSVSGFISNPLQTGAFVRDRMSRHCLVLYVSETFLSKLQMFETSARPASSVAKALALLSCVSSTSPTVIIPKKLSLSLAGYIELSPF